MDHRQSKSTNSGSPPHDQEYIDRLEREVANFADYVNVHDLPDIFHYWSNRYIRPWFEAVGTSHPEDFFGRYLLQASETCESSAPRFLSIGAGNGDAEVRVARDLIERGLDNFTLECLDINPSMLERGRALAEEAGLDHVLEFVQADFNDWRADGKYDGILANQCLHHVQNLEGLFDGIHDGLSERGLFITSDMIGRNGHQRWPEALEKVNQQWMKLPDRYKFNHQLRRLELEYINHDCSEGSFEGIRAQDILPLLIERFSFHVFIAFGNVVDVFIDRGFGHNFDINKEEDRAFIDRLHEIDEAGFADGSLSPTHLVAVMGRRNFPADEPFYARGLSPEKALRRFDTLDD